MSFNYDHNTIYPLHTNLSLLVHFYAITRTTRTTFTRTMPLHARLVRVFLNSSDAASTDATESLSSASTYKTALKIHRNRKQHVSRAETDEFGFRLPSIPVGDLSEDTTLSSSVHRESLFDVSAALDGGKSRTMANSVGVDDRERSVSWLDEPTLTSSDTQAILKDGIKTLTGPHQHDEESALGSKHQDFLWSTPISRSRHSLPHRRTTSHSPWLDAQRATHGDDRPYVPQATPQVQKGSFGTQELPFNTSPLTRNQTKQNLVSPGLRPRRRLATPQHESSPKQLHDFAPSWLDDGSLTSSPPSSWKGIRPKYAVRSPRRGNVQRSPVHKTRRRGPSQPPHNQDSSPRVRQGAHLESLSRPPHQTELDALPTVKSMAQLHSPTSRTYPRLPSRSLPRNVALPSPRSSAFQQDIPLTSGEGKSCQQIVVMSVREELESNIRLSVDGYSSVAGRSAVISAVTSTRGPRLRRCAGRADLRGEYLSSMAEGYHGAAPILDNPGSLEQQITLALLHEMDRTSGERTLEPRRGRSTQSGLAAKGALRTLGSMLRSFGSHTTTGVVRI